MAEWALPPKIQDNGSSMEVFAYAPEKSLPIFSSPMCLEELSFTGVISEFWNVAIVRTEESLVFEVELRRKLSKKARYNKVIAIEGIQKIKFSEDPREDCKRVQLSPLWKRMDS